MIGLYHNPPDKAVVLCVDEKSGIQTLDRSQPALPMMPGMFERRIHDYERNDVTRLFAAFSIADGTVIGELHRRHRAVEFLRFLTKIDKAVPAGLEAGPCSQEGSEIESPVWITRVLYLAGGWRADCLLCAEVIEREVSVLRELALTGDRN